MHTFPTFKLLVSIPWGDKSDEISLALEDYPLFAFVSPEQMRKARAPVRIRLDARGGMHALPDAPLRTPNGPAIFIHHFDAEGKFTGKTPLLFLDRRAMDGLFILDYAVDTDGSCYLLELIQSRQSGESNNRLQKISSGGEVQWWRAGPTSSEKFDFHRLNGNFKRLLTDGNSRLYLPATEHAGAIAEIDRDTGDVAHVYISAKFGTEVFMNERGTVIYVLYFPDVNRRGLGFFNLAEQKVTSVIGEVGLYRWLLYPFGVDASANVYAWNDSGVARISAGGRIDVIAAFDNVVVRARDRVIFTSRLRSDDTQSPVVQVERYSPAGETSCQELFLPEELSARHPKGWKLIHVDEQERYYVFGGEEPGQTGALVVYSNDGRLEETASAPRDLLLMESTLEGYSYWDVDSRGRVYLPVTDAQGFKVIRLTTGLPLPG
jgi:hypothetical protein